MKLSTRRFAMFIASLLLLSLSCTTLFPNMGDSPAGSDNGDQADSTQLDCERLDYPCSLAEADPAALERGGEVLNIAEEIYLQQDSMLAAGRRLAEESDVVELGYDERSLWFRVEGAPPMWLWDYEGFIDVEPGSSSTAPTGSYLARPITQASGPVGDQPPGQEPKKQALLLLPWAYEIGDDSEEIAAILNEHRNYQCPDCIDRQVVEEDPREAQPDDQGYYGPSLDRFRGWEAYDLLYVFSHGTQWCGLPDEESGGYFIEGSPASSNECAGMLTTGRFRKSIFDSPQTLDVTGVAWGKIPGEEWWIEAVSPDFFRSQYPDGLDDSIIFLNSCELMQNDGYVRALGGENTSLLGWTASARISRGMDTANAFFNRLIDDGLRVQKAHEKTLQTSGYNISDTYAGAALILKGDKNPRGVEIVTWMHPIYPQEVQAIGSLPVEGIPRDGAADQVMLRIRVDGIDEEQNPADFNVHVKIGDRELEQTLQPGDKVDEYTYEVTRLIDLASDVQGREVLPLEAWINLPSGGQSRHYLEGARLASCGWTGSASGAVSAEIRGDIALISTQLAEVDPAQLQDLEALGVIESMPSVSGVQGLVNQPETVILGGEESFPAAAASAGGVGMVALSQMNVGAGESLGNPLQFQQRTPEHIEGTINAGLTHLTSQQPMNLTAEFIWNAGSFCDINMILEAGKQQAPEGNSQ